MAGVVRWTFTDPQSLEVYTFEINPNDGGTPSPAKNLVFESASAEEGQPIIFEGRPKLNEQTASGTILTETQYNSLLYWYNKKRQIVMTDDLNRPTTIYISGIDFKRVRRVQAPWMHTYTLKYYILDWP